LKLYHYRAIENIHFGDAVFEKIMKSTFKKKLVSRFNHWREMTTTNNIRARFFHLMIRNKSASFFKILLRWKKLPDIRLLKKNQKSFDFFDNITSLYNRRINLTWTKLQKDNNESINNKIQAIQSMIESTT